MSNVKKNIFYFSPALPPASNAAAVRNYWFIKVLREHGHNLSVVTGEDLFFKLPSNQESAIKRLIKEAFAGLSLFFKVLFSKKDLYIFSSPPFITIMVGVLACWLRGHKYILDIRDIYPHVFFNLGLVSKDSISGKILLRITSIMFTRAHHVITVAEGLVKIIKDMSPKAKVKLIYNGYDDELFKPSKEKFEKFTVVFHGNLGKFQRIDLLREVAEKMVTKDPEVQFKVIGYGPGEKYLKDPPANLEFLGKMDYKDIAKYIAKCHLGISLRTDDQISRDALPVKMFEYIGVGIPVIVTPKGEAGKLVEKNKYGFQLENNEEYLIKKIFVIKKSDSFAINKSEENYSRKNQSAKILKVLPV